jgi:hypothetical protein
MNSHLQKLESALSAATGGISVEELNWHPAEKWCITEVLEHLYLTYTGTAKGFGRVLEAGKPLTTVASWPQRGRALVVVSLGYFPTGRKSPAMAQPRGLPAEKVVSDIRVKLAEMDEIITRCAGRFGERIKLLDHPILGPLSAGQWRKFHLVHGRHHVKQIQRLRQQQSA